MRSILPFVAALVAAVAIPLEAAELTVEAAIEAALANNPAVHAAAARLEAAAARHDQASAFRLPSVDLVSSAYYTDSPAEVFALQLNQERFSKDDFFVSDPNQPDPLTDWMTRVEVTQPLYTGGLLSARTSQADHLARAAALDLDRAREEVAFAAVTAYVNLAGARDMAALLATARATASRHLEQAQHYAAEGLLLEAEVLKARVYIAELDDQLAQVEAGVRLASSALNLTMGVDRGLSHELAPVPPGPEPGGDLAAWLSASQVQRRDLLAASSRLAAGQLEHRVAVAGFKPEVAVVGHYQIHDDVAFGTNGDNFGVMAVARINLFRGGGDAAAAAAASADATAGEAEIRRLAEGIQLEVEQAWLDISSARARLAAAQAAVAAAREALRVREQRFGQGLEKMIDLVDAETSLNQAEVRELTARRDLALARYRLHFTAGSSLAPPAAVEGSTS